MSGIGRVLIVAGSDSGGGAGIQADIKAVTAMGAYAATAITAITVQNTLGVSGIHEIPVATVAAQMRAVLDDIGADAVKTGMLHSAGVIEAVCAELDARARGVPLVCDPVMVAKGGTKLIDNSAVSALKDLLLPRAALVTPNAPEAEALTGVAISTREHMRIAADSLRRAGARAVLVKGGHLPGEQVHDLLSGDEGEIWFHSPRIETRNTHGTGCTLASAIAAGLAQGMKLQGAVARARDYVHEAIRTAPGFGRGHGPLNHMHGIKR